MVNAPTRRPSNRPRSGRRPPKGPRTVASDLRARLHEASAQLKADGHADHAAAVDAVLAPRGWTLLKPTGQGAGTSSLPVMMAEPLREAFKQAAKDKDVTLGAVVTDGFRKVIEGTWVPPKPKRAPSTPGGAALVNLNVRVDKDVRARLEELLPALSERLGYKLRLGGIATSWLREELGVEDD